VGCSATMARYALTQLRLNSQSSLSLHIPLPHGRGYLTPRQNHDSAPTIETIFLLIGLALAATGLTLMIRSDLLFIRNGTRRVPAQIVRHQLKKRGSATLYSAVLLVPDERGGFIEVRDPLTTPFPTPVIGERLTVVHPTGHPGKARIPYPWFRAGVYGVLGYGFVMFGLAVTGLG